jgi:hypothetical protein
MEYGKFAIGRRMDIKFNSVGTCLKAGFHRGNSVLNENIARGQHSCGGTSVSLYTSHVISRSDPAMGKQDRLPDWSSREQVRVEKKNGGRTGGSQKENAYRNLFECQRHENSPQSVKCHNRS